MFRFLLTTLCVVSLEAVPALAEVVSSEFASDPVTEGWPLVDQFGDLTTSIVDGVYVQEFENNCPQLVICGNEAFTISVAAFLGRPTWYVEHRATASASSNEFGGGGPAFLSVFNSFGVFYGATLAADKVELFVDVLLPFAVVDITPGQFHTIRLELTNDPQPASFKWFVDKQLRLEGLAEGPFPATGGNFPPSDARLLFAGSTWMEPNTNMWEYVRFGDIPSEASGDFDSDGAVSTFDTPFFLECLTASGEGVNAGPGCLFADFDGDTDTDCIDAAAFALAWTDESSPPPVFAACPPPPAGVPTVSHWGLLTLALLLLTTAKVMFNAARPSSERISNT